MSTTIMAKDQDSSHELTASVLVEAGTGDINKNKENHKFILTNTGKTPVRIPGLYQVWRDSTESKIFVRITSEFWKSDVPTEKHLKENINILKPGMSFSIGLPSGLLDSKKDVEITYEVSENFARKFDLWQGKLHLNFGSGLHESSK